MSLPTIRVTFTRIAQGRYLEEDNLKKVPKWIKEKLKNHENPNSSFRSITIVGKGKYQNANCLHVAYLYWRYLIANDDPNSEYLRDTFDQLLKDPRIDVRATFTEDRLYDREDGHFKPQIKYGGVYIENGNLAHYALLEDDFETMMKIVTLAPDLLSSTCSIVTRRWLLEKPPVEEIESAELLDPDEHQWITTNDLSENEELLKKIKNSSAEGLLAQFHWTEGNRSSVSRRNNFSLLHIAVRKANLVASVFIASKHTEIVDSKNLSPIEYAEKIIEGSSYISSKKKQKVTDIIEALKYVKPLPDPLPKAFYIQRKTGFDLLYFPATKTSIVREVLYKEMIESDVASGRRPAYKKDDSIPEIFQANAQDYKERGMAYGHLVPDADTQYSEKARKDAFLLTNFVPQDPVLNGGLWTGLENKVREMAGRHLCLHVYTGGVYKPKEEHKVKSTKYLVTGASDVGIPTHLFKVIYIFDYNETLRHKVYLIPNKAIKISGERNNLLEKILLKGKKPKDQKDLLLQKYKAKTSILQIQKLSGMNFQQYYQDNYPDWLEAK